METSANRRTRDGAADGDATLSRDGSVPAMVPLALLEAVRAHDRPHEMLEDEDLTSSLPRRLGLSGVIERQIIHYKQARRRGLRVPVAEVRDLLQLVLRRPDAEAILVRAGRETAAARLGRRFGPAALAVRVLPRSVTFAALRRTTRRLLRQLADVRHVDVAGPPLTVRIQGGLLAGMEAKGPACALYGGILDELLQRYTGSRPAILHECCVGSGDDRCEWRAPD